MAVKVGDYGLAEEIYKVKFDTAVLVVVAFVVHL